MKCAKLIGLFSLLVLSLPAFSQTEEIDLRHPPVANYYLNSKYKYRYAILQFDEIRNKNLFDKSYKASAVSLNEIKEIEHLIKKQVSVFNRTAINVIVKPEKYFKQFIAVTNSKGEKLVWVNCLCEVFGDVWKKRIPVVNDGGSCFFQIKINMTKKVAYDFYVNGLG